MRTLIASCALMLACCDTPVVGKIVCLVGDSNMEGLLQPLSYELSVGHLMPHEPFIQPRSRSDMIAVISAVRGARLSWATAIVPGRFHTARVQCDQVVVSLGVNDIGDAQLPLGGEVIDAQLDTILGVAEIAGRSVLWIAPRPDAPTYDPERVHAFRMALWRAEQRWPELEVLDVEEPGLDSEGVHFTTAGYGDLAYAVAERLEHMP